MTSRPLPVKCPYIRIPVIILIKGRGGYLSQVYITVEPSSKGCFGVQKEPQISPRCSTYKAEGLGCTVGFRVQGLGFRVQGQED